MPLDLVVTLVDGKTKTYNIPLAVMRGSKSHSKYDNYEVVSEDWPWTNPTFNLCINEKMEDIARIEIDPSLRLSDVNRTNNIYPQPEEKKEK